MQVKAEYEEDPEAWDDQGFVTYRRRKKKQRRRKIHEQHNFPDDGRWNYYPTPPRRKKHKHRNRTYHPNGRASALKADNGVHNDPHMDSWNREALQQLVKEETCDGAGVKRIIKPTEVRNSSGAEREGWRVAAENEMNGNFIKTGAYHISTQAERDLYGRPLPMLCVWSYTDTNLKKCRACVCVCGNFAEKDPLEQSWTAQAEPSSLLASLTVQYRRNGRFPSMTSRERFLMLNYRKTS